MLVISQKKGEKLHIGRDITISILDLQSGKVRLGIEAPSAYQILRDTLYDAAAQASDLESKPEREHEHELEHEHALEHEQNAPASHETHDFREPHEFREPHDSQADAAPYKRAKSKLKSKGHAY